MKPLNRPMFKYGGPIKEGIMSGMKDRAALVGDPVFPKAPDGRAKHAIQIPIMIGAGLQALRLGAQRAIPKIANLFRTQVGTKSVPKQGPTFTMPGKNVYSKGFPGGKVPAKTIGPGTAEVPVMGPTKLGSYLQSDPLIATGSKVVQGLVSPTSKGIIQKGARIVFSPTGIATGLFYAGGKFFDGDGKEVPPPENANELIIGGKSGAPGGGDPGMYLTPKQSKADADKIAKDRIEANRKRYYELMGLDKAKKDDVYRGLIDASNIIQEEGADLKGSIKSGTLQNRIINALSKQLDKSADLKKQIDAAILKGEITKDIEQSKVPDNIRTARMLGISDKEYKDKILGNTNLKDNLIAAYNKQGSFPAGNQLAGFARNSGINITGVEDSQAVKDWMEANSSNEEGYIQSLVKEGKVPDGTYVINNRIFQVNGQDITSIV